MTACVVVSVLAVPQRSAAAPSLALPAADYPRSTQVIVLPATDAEADRYFGPVHRSTFETLGRTDGVGWIQAGIWHFSTGAGSAVRTHQTVFAYGIHVFASKADAHHALLDVKLRTHGTHVARLYAKRYVSSDARQTLSFLFFTFHEILVEIYYEYGGVAPASIAASLHHMFSKQSSHLAARARALDRAIHTPPTPPARPTSGATPSPTATSTASPTATATVIPTATASPTATATPPPTATPTITPTSTPVTLQVAGTPSSPVVAPGSKETIHIHVSLGAQGVAGAVINITFYLPSGPVECDTATDANGDASCFIIIPSDTPVGTQVDVTLFARAPDGEVASGSTRFTVR